MYRTLIRETMARAGKVGAADPRHVEAWMRSGHPTLDALSMSAFEREVAVALRCIAASTAEKSEALAASYGM